MRLTPLDRCPLCSGPRLRLFRKGTVNPQALGSDDFKITDSRYGSRWTFSACRDCSFVFANPMPDAEAIAGFYAGLEDDEYSREEEGRGRNFALILERLARHAPPGALLLDVGAASGIFLNLARHSGYRVAGIEPSAALVADAERLYGLKLFHGTAGQFVSRERFQIVTLLDVLEHVTDPHAFLGGLDRFLAPGAVLAVVTPDVDSLAARLVGGRWWHYRTAHVTFFNRRTLDRLLRAHGYEVVERARFAWNFSLHYLWTRLLPLRGGKSLQEWLKRIHLKLHLFDSWEVYARKSQG
ncbi:MAG: class I SAM-dependent methyltransferase [Candidatus Aminicenantes bacterium]|nr:class I SAM-dependent methyltransferase [Candidatus Aminicenantes bacterium]